MKDNLSIVITVILLVLLMVIFPLYNFFERQDDMSYNLVLKATTNFADQVMNNGYIDQNTYDKFVTELGNTGNVYDIQIEAHRKVLTVDENGTDVYTEQSYIDYADDIFESITNSTDSNLMKKSLKNNIYLFNPKDEIYVKVKNSNTTMAGSLFNTIVPASKKERIVVNYGGIIKNNAWKDIDARYKGHELVPGAPVISLKDGSGNVIKSFNDVNNPVYEVKKSDIDSGHFVAISMESEGIAISKYTWKLTDLTDDTNTISDKETTKALPNLQDIGTFLQLGHEYSFEVYALNDAGYKSDTTKITIKIVNKASETPETGGKNDFNNDDLDILNGYLDGNITLTDEQKKKYNINGDTEINQTDYNYLKEIIDYGYILGDIDGDNRITIDDVTLVQKYIAGMITFTDEQFKRADINRDGNVDNTDLDLLNKR